MDHASDINQASHLVVGIVVVGWISEDPKATEISWMRVSPYDDSRLGTFQQMSGRFITVICNIYWRPPGSI
jgi:hypothetical protein